ncbi:indolepyruvate ferredoxin oxidoreductase family protein [Methylovirgula sp. 4M-Z18]|uniref:indolepyruvate ferredoxin oxidoreductase family protein n=1 Tax=Methylovirgula sp. 4M-Z18 TaxID=2293567 RepID=UPI000E2EB1A0|nr:indolepyruvate ferredoxin oxidoreductase family protein [Methylovirgula sp. 4M-Z18]RFB79200.1 indolepyruvate ferredoxin oxidoreductase family protein [Methylovirgula sp. 4M-Z18]
MTDAVKGQSAPGDVHLAEVSLDDKYDLTKSRVFVSGNQAIARLLLMQKERDRQAGLNTAAFVSGYRGSPLSTLDQTLLRAGKVLKAQDIVFQPGLNEELAATAVWGSQQAEMRGEGKFDGVFSIWYGKGPGVDRSGDVFRHANLAGTSPHGGVLALMGDDHTAESSTTAHQSEFHFVDVMIPVLSPAGVQEIFDYGLYGWALSRFAGVWVGLKCVKDTIESTASIDGSIDRVQPVIPADFKIPEGGLNIRPRDGVLAQEARLQDYKRDAIVAWLRANKLNHTIMSGGPNAKVGVITVGKSYLDVRQALDGLGIDEVKANRIGLRLYKIGCPWPLEPEGLKEFARGLDLIIVVEEKRSLIEVQVREELYGSAHQPTCVGKKDEQGNWLFPIKASLDPNDIAVAIGERLLRYNRDQDIERRVQRLQQAQAMLAETQDAAQRVPYFCSGCPHNSSTKVPEGMRAYAGIGCHYMVQWMDRATEGFTQMGGEGANWIGEAPFSKRGHIFQNLGDGTFNHSGILALRWAIDTNAQMTYKILFNDAVAMTGGQHHEGDLTVDQLARQVAACGAKKIVLVTDEPDKYPPGIQWPAGITIHHRNELDPVQRDLARVEGTSVMIFDQTCAAEKRRRRKHGLYPDPNKRVIINELVCEGCGDCGVQSNCVSVQPVETEFGRKRVIDQSSCNKDFSCVNGFCPSFVTVHGAKIRKATRNGAAENAPPTDLPEPVRREIGATPYGILVTGVGGTGVVTIGAILGMAAHLEGKGCGMIDMAGLAQKGGAVYSHVKLARKPDDIHAIRVAAGEADLVLGCDLVVSGTKKVLAAVRKGETGVVVNTAEIYPGDFARNADYSLPSERIKRAILQTAGDSARFVNATAIATSLLGNSIAANMFMLGLAYQLGYVPLSAAAIEQAIHLNGEAVNMNVSAFRWGRRMAIDPAAIETLVAPLRKADPMLQLSQTLDDIVARRAQFLAAYQSARYARRYQATVQKIREAEARAVPGKTNLSEAVARYLFKLMAIKDEYEVARLYTDGSFMRQVQATFEGDLRFEFHLAPPILGRRDANGQPVKTAFGPWMMKAFKVLASLKGLRGTLLDIFGYMPERKHERALLADYKKLLNEIARALTPGNHAAAVALAALPEKIRGYGYVKERNIKTAKAEEESLLQQFRAPQRQVRMAAE